MSEKTAAGAAIIESLERYVEQAGDPVPLIYQRFFEKYPETQEIFGTDDRTYAQQRMMDKVFVMLMDQATEIYPPRFATYWVADHVSWGVDWPMVTDMMAIILDTLREGLGDAWTDEMEEAWRALLARMMPAIEEDLRDAEAIRDRISVGVR